MKQLLIKYLSFAVFVGTLISNSDIKSMSKPGSGSTVELGVIGTMLALSGAVTTAKKFASYFGSKTQPAPQNDAVAVNISVDTPPQVPTVEIPAVEVNLSIDTTQPLTANIPESNIRNQVTEGISDFFKPRLESFKQNSFEFYNNIKGAVSEKYSTATSIIQSNKFKITIALVTAAYLYKKMQDNKKNKGSIYIDNRKGGKIIIQRQR